MRRIRYLTMAVVCLIGCIAAWGQSDFNPASPSEPGAPVIKYALNLTVATGQGGSVSGAGSYAPGTNVTLYAYPSTGYAFEAWADVDGNVLSTTANYVYTTQARKETLVAHFRFTPGSPTEPDTPSKTLYYRLDVQATTGGSVSGGGRYLAGNTIYVYAYTDTGFDFVNWTNEAGDVVSVSQSFNYTKKTENEVLTAHFRYNPSSPTEPSDPILRHNIKATCTDGGTWSGTTGRILEGNTGYLSAYANTGYEFDGWYLNGELYTNLSSFNYTVGKENMDFEARFRFNPASPSEPKMPAISTYSYYLMTINALPGTVISYPINLMNTQAVKDINIRLTFPEGMEVSPENFVLSDKAVGYEVTIAEAKDDISIIEEGAKLYDFTMIGGTTEPGTQALLTFQVKIPDTMPTGSQRQVKINQISMTMEDGTAVTARTRNGRIGVYKLGDSNGDDDVTVSDFTTIANNILGLSTEIFIDVAANVNQDEDISVSDLTGVANIILYGSATGETPQVKTFFGEGRLRPEINMMISPFDLCPGQETKVKVNVENHNADFSAYQFDVSLPEGVSIKDACLSTARTTKRATDFFSYRQLENGTYRVLCASTIGSVFKGENGTVAVLTLEANEDAALGMQNLDVTNICFSKNANSLRADNISVPFEMANATGVEKLDAHSTNGDIYNIQGMKIDCQKKGINIVNGRKFYKK